MEDSISLTPHSGSGGEGFGWSPEELHFSEVNHVDLGRLHMVLEGLKGWSDYMVLDYQTLEGKGGSCLAGSSCQWLLHCYSNADVVRAHPSSTELLLAELWALVAMCSVLWPLWVEMGVSVKIYPLLCFSSALNYVCQRLRSYGALWLQSCSQHGGDYFVVFSSFPRCIIRR